MSSSTNYRCKCVVLGDGCIGKTCMLHSYANNGEYLANAQKYVPTIFENYDADVPMGSGTEMVKLSLWDTAGQEEFDELRRMCYGEGAVDAKESAKKGKGAPSSPSSNASFDVSVFCVAFALDNPTSFTNVEMKWYRELRRVEQELLQKKGVKKTNLSPAERPFAVILVGTKCDLTEDHGGKLPRDGKKAISKAQAEELKERLGADAYCECSSIANQGVREVFECALAAWYERMLRQEEEAKRQAASGGKKDKDGSCTML